MAENAKLVRIIAGSIARRRRGRKEVDMGEGREEGLRY